jgi:RNA polymerase sigma-70 factor (ECF subfamily)
MGTDHDTIARILSGDSREFGTLVERYKDRAYALACRLLGSKEEAEETVQDAFLKAYRSLPGFRGDAKFGTWFYRILYNSCMTRVTRRQPPPLPLEEIDLAGLDAVSEADAPNGLESLAAEERSLILNEELQKLPEKFRVVLTLFYMQEQRYEEIAAILDVPLNTVKTHLFRARTLLRKRVAERYSEQTRAA